MTYDEYYSPGQLRIIASYVKEPPAWFLLGGPGRANEMQTARELWPLVKGVGVELSETAVAWQHAHGWPADCHLFRAALSDYVGDALLEDPGEDMLHGRVYFPRGVPAPGDVPALPLCPTTTWDELDKVYGPFHDAAMWLDVEGSEEAALLGAENLFDTGRVRLVNVELLASPDDRAGLDRVDRIHRMMTLWGFNAVEDWNAGPECRDRVYVFQE